MEWNFTYENQEASSFLVYQLEKSEQLDTVGMGMLSNNQIPHILPLLYTQIDEERYLRYAIPGRIPLGDYLEGMVSKERLLKVLLEICDAVEEGQAYMLDSSKLVLEKRYIFTNVSTGEVSLVYLPVFGRETAVELCNFFRKIIFGTQFDSREDCSYIATIINYLNGDVHFIVTDFKKLVQTLLGQRSQPAARPVETPVQKPAAPTPVPVPKPASVPKPAPAPRPVAAPGPATPKPISVPKPSPASVSIPTPEPPKKKGFSLKFPSKKNEKPKKEKPKKEKPKKEKAGTAIPSIPIPGRENRKPEPQGFTEVKAQPAEWGNATRPANFGQTSVLSQEIGQTTVLSGGPQASGAELIRKKNGQSIPLDKSLIRIGTERSFVDYWVSDNTAVSRSHADVISHEGVYYIRDNHSTNHTYVNGAQIPSEQEQMLKDGDQILLGNEPFEFRQR